MTEMIGILKAALELGVCPQSLRNWEKAGLVPPALRMGLKGSRRYSAADIEALRAAIFTGPSGQKREAGGTT